jgi:tetratricopeptide (TPR) repeat protein
VQHDQVRFYTESGYPEAAIPVAESLLEQFPDRIPVLNNLSLSQFMAGNTEQAIATAQKVLGLEPNNVHALGNLTRFTYLSGLSEQAKQYASRLQQITDDSPDMLERGDRATLARMLTQEKRIEEAKDLLIPILQRTKLHFSEFRVLARAQMDLTLADGRPEGLRCHGADEHGHRDEVHVGDRVLEARGNEGRDRKNNR